MIAKLTYRTIFLSGLFTIQFFSVLSQVQVEGFVYDRGTNSPVPFANVMVLGGQRGAATDTLGYFRFSAPSVSDTIRITNLGYRPLKLPIAVLKDTIYLTAVATELGVFNVTPGKNPAFAVMDRVVLNKEANNAYANHKLRYEEYQKVRFDLNHFTDK